jgi:hypothetical protein
MAIAPQSLAGSRQRNARAVRRSVTASPISSSSATKVVDYVSIIDSFDAVEQLLGYNLDAY